jgi:hypothetical protein
VEVSPDGGATWVEARLTGTQAPSAWRLWGVELEVAAGMRTLVVRATDTNGHAAAGTPDLEPERHRLQRMAPGADQRGLTAAADLLETMSSISRNLPLVGCHCRSSCGDDDQVARFNEPAAVAGLQHVLSGA